MRVLLVEDDPVLSEMMLISLREAGHRVDHAATAAAAGHFWQVQPFDVVLLDLNLPDGNGLGVLRKARQRGDRTPVLALTARNRTEERISGLDAGADDYLGKPFDLGEVEARLRALVRRVHGTDDQCEVGGLMLHRRTRRFYTRSGDAWWPLDLPARESEVLSELMTPPGSVVNKRKLSDKLSGLDEALGDNALEAFISRLRKKIAGSGASIRTLRGLGYLIEAVEPPSA